ncbi:hypothetical protein [Echinicola shivajiensis]|uniref:hypothetical protein n=1 Tax=Echinicola shivajiensis TaxID=1035916 RepID=UPI001BFBF712|nr:hypothetical protein [Echinicola shivajiensis]
MKKLKLVLLSMVLALCFFSCKEEFEPAAAIQGEWELIKANSGWSGDIPAGELDYSETYIFNKDGSFVKKREGKDESFQISGNYTYEQAEITDSSMARVYMTLDYTNEVNRAWLCSEEKEEFVLTHQGELFKSCPNMADGPIYYFKKK